MATEPAPEVHPGHDDVYAAVFGLVGQKPNETYEGLIKVLPSIKDTDQAELKELAARQALREMFKPSIDPLRLEYEKAAAEDDVDDLSTDEGDWLEAIRKAAGGEDDEDLDEHGIPIMKLSRASSSFILDGPGDVKVDNFTPEGEGEGDVAAAGGAGPTPPGSDAAPSLAPAKAPAAASAAPYAPYAIRLVQSAATAAATSAAAAAAAPVVTLEDEIRAMRAARGEHSQQAGAPTGGMPTELAAAATAAAPSPAPETASAADVGRQPGEDASRQRRQIDEDEDDDAPEVVPEPQGALLPPPTGGSSSRSLMLPPSTVAPPGTVDVDVAAEVAAAAAAATGVMGGDDEASLPGTCQDTGPEDALWAAMRGVDPRALLEHMGLAVPAGGSDGGDAEDAESLPEPGPELAAPEQRQHLQEQQQPALTNGHIEGEAGSSGSSRAGSTRGQVETEGLLASGRPGVTDDAPEVAATAPEAAATAPEAAATAPEAAATAPEAAATAAVEETATTVITVAETAAATEAAEMPAVAVETAETATAAAETSSAAADGAGAVTEDTAADEAGAAEVVSGPDAVADGPPSSADGPTFEAVETFSLDPDFDYDNVVLTRRDFPYSMLNARWASGAGMAPR